MKLCLLRGRAFLVDDQHGSAFHDLGIDHGDGGAGSADTAVRGGVAWHASDMVPHPGSCQTHPERHGRSDVFASFGDFIDAGVGVSEAVGCSTPPEFRTGAALRLIGPTATLPVLRTSTLALRPEPRATEEGVNSIRSTRLPGPVGSELQREGQ